MVWHLRYDDEYELTDAGWRISRRALTINAIETRPVRRLLPRDPAHGADTRGGAHRARCTRVASAVVCPEASGSPPERSN